MYTVGTPVAQLRPYIERYWFVCCPPGETFDLSVDVYVDGQADLVINHGSPYRRIDRGDSEHTVPFSSIDAQRTRPVRIVQSGNVQVCGARFTVGGLSAFTTTSMQTLTDRIVAAAAVLGESFHDLVAELEGLRPDTATMTRALDTFFLGRLSPSNSWRASSTCVAAIEEKLPDEVTVSTTAAKVGISTRTLQRNFERAIGLKPGFYIRVARFQRAIRMMMDNQNADLGRVAQDAGYYDQPHLVREFHALAGGIPKRYRGYLPAEGRDFAPNVVTYRQ